MAKKLKVGPTEFYIENMSEWTKEKFIQVYKGKLDYDLDLVWSLIEKERIELKKESESVEFTDIKEEIGSTRKPVKKSKKTESK